MMQTILTADGARKTDRCIQDNGQIKPHFFFTTGFGWNFAFSYDCIKTEVETASEFMYEINERLGFI